MFRLLDIRRKTILVACCLVSLIAVIALTLSVKTSSQQMRVLNQKDKDELLKQVENSPEQPLRIVGNNDSPLQIVEASVKEISNSDFSKLTGKMTTLPTVSSVPRIQLVNNSGKTITEFVLGIRKPGLERTRGVVQPKISIAPNETFTLERKNFITPEKSAVNENGQSQQQYVLPEMNSEKYWIQFANRSDLVVMIGSVTFDDGSIWEMKKEDR